MALFDPRLREKPQVVAVNKGDQPEVQERWQEIKKSFKKKKIDVVLISALARTGTRELLLKAAERLAETPKPEEVAPELPVYRPAEDPRAFTISRVPGGWRIQSKAIERAAEMTPWNQDGAVRRFQKLMERLGVDEALKKAGAQEGDTVFIGEYELEYQE